MKKVVKKVVKCSECGRVDGSPLEPPDEHGEGLVDKSKWWPLGEEVWDRVRISTCLTCMKQFCESCNYVSDLQCGSCREKQ
jgi:hypothetical protein